MKVKATDIGYYANRIRNEGEVFEIKSEKDLGSWMEKSETKSKKKAKE